MCTTTGGVAGSELAVEAVVDVVVVVVEGTVDFGGCWWVGVFALVVGVG